MYEPGGDIKNKGENCELFLDERVMFKLNILRFFFLFRSIT